MTDECCDCGRYTAIDCAMQRTGDSGAEERPDAVYPRRCICTNGEPNIRGYIQEFADGPIRVEELDGSIRNAGCLRMGDTCIEVI